MARAFTILLVLVYAFSATGATVHLHYCCGQLQKLAVQADESTNRDDCPLCTKHHEDKKTSDCGSEERCGIDQQSSGHCQDVKIDAEKTTGEHLAGNAKNPVKIYPWELLVFTLIGIVDLPLDIHQADQATDTLPVTGPVPLFIQHCTYRI